MTKKCPPCDATKICNPPTGRCVIKTGKAGKALVIEGMYRSIVGKPTAPLSPTEIEYIGYIGSTFQPSVYYEIMKEDVNRPVNEYPAGWGSILRRASKNTAKKNTTKNTSNTSRCPPCEATKICNPPTGRCVLKTGPVGKKLLGNAPASKKPAANTVRNADGYIRNARGAIISFIPEFAVVNASKRIYKSGPKKGQVEPVPKAAAGTKGRSAPAGHASDYPYAMSKGTDKSVWYVSRPKSDHNVHQGTFTWFKATKAEMQAAGLL